MNKVVVPHADRVAVRPTVEDARLIAAQGLIHIDGQVVQTAEMRHGARLTIGEQMAEFLFGS